MGSDSMAWRYAASYDARRGPVAVWLLSIARNAAVDQASARGRRVEQHGLDEVVDDVADDGIERE